MDRLTFEGNFCDIAMCQEVPGGSFCEDGYCSQKKVWERLKQYEDTGLSPEVCRNYKLFEDEAISKSVPFTRIVELMNADAEGRLIVLPCKMGGVIYRAINSRPIKGDKPWKYIKQSRLTWNSLEGALRDFGKTVFLTREAAEASLKGEINGLA